MNHKLHLTFPPTHTAEDVDYLFNEYREQFPERFREWVEIEKDFKEEDNPLRRISIEGLRFLREICDADSTFAVSRAWLDIRLKVIEFSQSN